MIYKKARAKINLTLNVLNKREDGYHNIESIFQKISLYDEVFAQKGNEDAGIVIKSNVLPLEGEENIICKVYYFLKEQFDEIKSVNVKLKKNIPMQAGLGGGSADCATFINCMNELFKLNLSRKDMKEIGVKFGADVPSSFCNKPVVVRGIGEKIEEFQSDFRFYLCLIKPSFSCDTQKMYERLDNTNLIKQKYNSDIVKWAIQNKDIEILTKNVYNVFENSVDCIYEVKQELINQGALCSLMTGTGSCVYGIFKNRYDAKKAYNNLRKKYESYFCFTI